MAAQTHTWWPWVVYNIKFSQWKNPIHPGGVATPQSQQPLDQLHMNLESPGLLMEPCLQSILKMYKGGDNLISRRIVFQREEATTKKALFIGPTRCTSLIDGTHNIPCIPTPVGCVDVTGEKQSFKLPSPKLCGALKVITSSLNCTQKQISNQCNSYKKSDTYTNLDYVGHCILNQLKLPETLQRQCQF